MVMFGCSFRDLPSRCDSNSLAVSVGAQSPNSSHGCSPEQMAWWSWSQLGTPQNQCGVGMGCPGILSPIQCPQMPTDHVLLSPRASGSPRTPGICTIHCCSLWGTSCMTPRTRGCRLGPPGPLGLLSTQDTIRAPIFRVLLPARRCCGLWGSQGLLRLLASPAGLCPCPGRVQYSFLVAGIRRCGKDHLLELDPAARRLNRTDGQADGQISDRYGVFPGPVQAERELSPDWGEAPQCQH